MDHHLTARAGLSVVCGVQGIATVAIDLNRTHATNALWTRHARFHVVWQTLTVALQAIVELGLLWSGLVGAALGFYLALLLASISPLAFLFAFATEKWFGGALSDPNGIPPVRIVLFAREADIDMNLVAVLAALVTNGVILLLFRF